MPIKQTAGRDRLGEFAPEFARTNWVTKSEMAEILTHIAFYADLDR